MAPSPSRSTAEHIQSFLLRHHSQRAQRGIHTPLIVGLQGPQGSGKTTVTRNLVDLLATPPHSLRTAALSIDDFYLTHAELDALARDNPNNPLLHGRGQPGTHDVDLLARTLASLAQGQPVDAPTFDKSLFNGQGDRSKQTIPIPPNQDIVLLEGWCLGFRPRDQDDLLAHVDAARRSKVAASSSPPPYFLRHSDDNLVEINRHLARYEHQFYDKIDVMIRILPDSLDNVFRWRLQAEHQMKAHNGGRGMTDQEVTTFIQRYMPGYELWGQSTERNLELWSGRGLQISLDVQRQVTGVQDF
ncbi:uncharacterized protein PFL1_01519 [Pseudozyma flocculosa PF-1]|uniref:Related to ATP-binding protein, putative pantothenate kinase n=1 Tax=Pseudozyma flocculosa TaxID=84751 RepID=A0A5C3FBZ8_9BASI|nr:uncharacterized protein PFL1_01519 [Pseudozyma flocculosa PF-1]EPQ31335.1 hypothetical protein PFL1_01519 [Pseudozyma flocculosa PF-1]SPO41800.1 related to ATP-binding protein, putative pantothenate kinase [Pseudozyma flocculosa]